MGWYVVETELHRETLAQDEIQELGLETFLPKMRRTKRLHYRISSGAPNPFLLIFPRYLFVRFDLTVDKGVWPAIRRQRGVRTILGLSASNPDFPSAIREVDFMRLQELAVDLMKEAPLSNGRPTPLAPETVIQVLWGPMGGRLGKIEFDNGIRADVLLMSAGVASKISLPRELIEAV